LVILLAKRDRNRYKFYQKECNRFVTPAWETNYIIMLYTVQSVALSVFNFELGSKEENIMKWIKQWYLLCLLTVITAIMVSGCGTASYVWKAYEGSAVEKSFPVPKEANKTEIARTVTKMDYVRYAVPGLKEDGQLPKAYEKEITAWGWTEDKEKETDSSYVFTKNNLVVQVSLQKNSFILYVPKINK
jgi:hypothetical protein